MLEFLEIGRIRLPVSWLFIGLGLCLAFVAIRYRLKETTFDHKQIIDTIFNSLFYGFIIWKISYVLIYPQYAFANPLGILYFSGGQNGVILATFIGIFYTYYQSYKQKVPITIYADLLLTGWFIGSVVYFLYFVIEQPFFYSGQIILSLALFIFLITKSWKLANTVLTYSLGQVFLQFFSNQMTFFYGFTKIQLIFLLIALLAFVLQWKGETNEKV